MTRAVAFQRAGAWSLAPRPGEPKARPLSIAVAGCGAVGSAFVALIQDQIASAGADPPFELARVLVRHPDRARSVAIDPALLTKSVSEFLETPADIVVEAITSAKSARRLALAALSARRAYITANRALIAECGPDLMEIAAHHGAALEFGAALGGALPLVKLLREEALGFGLNAVRATFDGGGEDAAERLGILAWLAFGADPRRLVVRRRGLPDAAKMGAAAQAVGGLVRLLAEAVDGPGGVVAAVEPAILSVRSPLAAAPGETVVAVQSRSASTILLRGRAESASATASLLLTDLRGLGARPPGPVPPRRSASDDPRLLWWLVLTPEVGQDLVASFCRTHGLEHEAIGPGAEGSRRLVAVRATSNGLGPLLARLGGRGLRAHWIRWER